MKTSLPELKNKKIQYDYKNQAWIIDGEYVACNHPASMDCHCYGKIHAGTRPSPELVRSGAIQ